MKYPVVASALGLAAIPGAALAHVPGAHLAAATGAHTAHQQAHFPTSLPLLLLAVAAVALGWALLRDRRVALTALALVLGCAGVEAAYHGVHHLGDRDAAEKCVVFTASAHVDGLTHDGPASPAPAAALEAVAPSGLASTPAASLTGLHEGRAPPQSSSI